MSSSTPTPKPVLTLRDFDFALPNALIAQQPSTERSASRLLDGRNSAPSDRIFYELAELLREGDLLVFNDTQVVKARLWGEKPSGGKIELLVERVLGQDQIAAHLRASKKPAVGTRFKLQPGAQQNDEPHATLLGRWPDENGALFRLQLGNNQGDDPHTLMARHGHVPLPPYIERARSSPIEAASDAQRYQSVFAKHPGAVAAPTAALHFDQDLLDRLSAAGVQQAFVTLHIGAGTFVPVKTEDLSQHRMHSEWYEAPAATLQAIAECKARGGRVVAVGTTTVRTLESWAQSQQASGDTQIFITPGFRFQVADLLITNFHLPKSSLMMLVSAFAGHAHVMNLYHHAIAAQYRFYSFGDAMLLQRATP